MCDEYRIRQARTGRPVLAGQSDPLFEPASLLMTTPTPSTEVPAQEDFLQKYKERVERLSQQNRVIKICSDAGFLTTVEVGQYFMPKDTVDFSQFTEPVACREYTLPRDEKSSDPKGWIRGNTKIGPVFETHHPTNANARHRDGHLFSQVGRLTLARQFGKVCTISIRLVNSAGTDCVGHAVRAMTDADPNATILSIDGIGAYDHVLRSAMMSKLYSVPELRGLLPFVRSTYAHPKSYRWQDAVGVTHQVHQVEGGEQGDPLMPLLFSLAIHDALMAVKAELREGEVLFAFLDDVYAVCGPNRTREVFDLLVHHL